MDTANSVASYDLSATLDQSLRAIVEDFGASEGTIMLEGDDEGQKPAKATYTAIEGSGTKYHVEEERTHKALEKRAPSRLETPGTNLLVPLIGRTKRRVGLESEQTEIGGLSLSFNHLGDSLDTEDLALLKCFGYLLGAAASIHRSETRQHSVFLKTMESLVIALEARDDYTRGHSQRVCEVSLLLGSELGFSASGLEELRIGATLHDIGKIGVPDGILNKTESLSFDEEVIMRRHATIGFEICTPLDLSEGILTIIRNHHEKLDGTGYPDQLAGNQLGLPLRIACVSDAFDAMSSCRPYRSEMPIKMAVEELRKRSGRQFDPEVVAALEKLIAQGSLDCIYGRFWHQPVNRAA